MTQPQQIIILANLKARGKNRKKLESAAALAHRHLPTRIIYTATTKEASLKAAELSQLPSIIIAACGGDGTVNTILNSARPETTLGIIPSGTANVIARELGIPLDYTNACKNLLTGAVKKIDTPTLNGRRFLFAAGVGYDAYVASNINPGLKKTFGKFAYHIESVKRFFTYKPPKLSVSVDDENTTYHGSFLICANMRRYGGDLFFAPEARCDDGILDLILLKRFKLSSLLKLFNFARKTAKFPSQEALTLRGRRFIIESNTQTNYQLDGESFAATNKFEIGLSSHKTRILTP